MHCSEPEGENRKLHLRFLSSTRALYDFLFSASLYLPIFLAGILLWLPAAFRCIEYPVCSLT